MINHQTPSKTTIKPSKTILKSHENHQGLPILTQATWAWATWAAPWATWAASAAPWAAALDVPAADAARRVDEVWMKTIKTWWFSMGLMGFWLVVWNMFWFSQVLGIINPIDWLIFFRGFETTSLDWVSSNLLGKNTILIGKPEENDGCPWDFLGFTIWLCQNSFWKWPSK